MMQKAKQIVTTIRDVPFNYINACRQYPKYKIRDYDVLNPATGEVLTSISASGKGDVEDAVNAAKEAFKSWSKVSIPSIFYPQNQHNFLYVKSCVTPLNSLWKNKHFHNLGSSF